MRTQIKLRGKKWLKYKNVLYSYVVDNKPYYINTSPNVNNSSLLFTGIHLENSLEVKSDSDNSLDSIQLNDIKIIGNTKITLGKVNNILIKNSNFENSMDLLLHGVKSEFSITNTSFHSGLKIQQLVNGFNFSKIILKDSNFNNAEFISLMGVNFELLNTTFLGDLSLDARFSNEIKLNCIIIGKPGVNNAAVINLRYQGILNFSDSVINIPTKISCYNFGNISSQEALFENIRADAKLEIYFALFGTNIVFRNTQTNYINDAEICIERNSCKSFSLLNYLIKGNIRFYSRKRA
jgi:hypothetical protein